MPPRGYDQPLEGLDRPANHGRVNLVGHDAPRPRRNCSEVTLARLDLSPVHRVDVVLAGFEISPEDVALAIAVVISRRHDGPIHVRNGAYVAFAGLDGAPVHWIQVVFTRGS